MNFFDQNEWGTLLKNHLEVLLLGTARFVNFRPSKKQGYQTSVLQSPGQETLFLTLHSSFSFRIMKLNLSFNKFCANKIGVLIREEKINSKTTRNQTKHFCKIDLL